MAYGLYCDGCNVRYKSPNNYDIHWNRIRSMLEEAEKLGWIIPDKDHFSFETNHVSYCPLCKEDM